MSTYQFRVVKEKAELEVKIEALETFIESNPIFPTLPEEERGLLQSQLDVMLGYAGILTCRRASRMGNGEK